MSFDNWPSSFFRTLVDIGFPFEPTLFLRFGDAEGVVCLFMVFDLSRRVIELEGTGTVVRGAEATACEAAASRGVNMLRVRSSHGSIEPWLGSEGLPPRRFFVADSS